MEQTLPKMLRAVADKYPEVNAQYFRNKSGDFIAINYHEFYQNALDFGAALLSLGVKRGERIGLISDNRKEWEQADMGLLSIGAIDSPRGCDATEQDLSYILSFAECSVCIAENTTQIKKILNVIDKIPLLKTFICFDAISEREAEECRQKNINFYQFADLLKTGHEWRKSNPDAVEAELEKGKRDDLASIIFTSGTTGTPKGVMLSHGNFVSQLDELVERIYLNPGERALCVLPVWHAYQRSCEYVIIAQGAAICYSKPIGSILLGDIQKLNPHLMPAVPRVWESVYDGIWRKMRKTGGITYALFKFFVNEATLWNRIDRKLRRKNARFGSDFLGFWWPVLVLPWLLLYPVKMLGNLIVFRKIRKMLGKNFRAGIAGGGAYPSNLDEFFWAIGVKIVEGYGLTETSPIVSVRPIADPIYRTVGSPIRNVNVRIVDDDGIILGKCKKGHLQVKGETVMKGYYKREDLTSKVMTVDGWFDTGDIAILTENNEIQLRGRAKDTIVLHGGENIEPLPIEEALNSSRYIAASVVVGTNEKGVDQKYLGVLILPVQEEITAYAKENAIEAEDYSKLVELPQIRKLIETEINNCVSAKTGFKSYERIAKFEIITKPFEVGVELSAKQDIVRYKICEIYKDKIAKLFREDK